MIQYERKQLILEQLRGSEVAHIEELVDTTGASPSTVRRDIDALVKSGKIIALRGGAIKLNDRPSELPTSEKRLINRDAKQAIAAAAAELVHDGDTVYIDSGTTTLQMMPLLRHRRIHVITSNTQIFTMAPGDRVRVTILAGDWIASIGSIAGSLTERLLSELYFDKAFIGASGCGAGRHQHVRHPRSNEEAHCSRQQRRPFRPLGQQQVRQVHALQSLRTQRDQPHHRRLPRAARQHEVLHRGRFRAARESVWQAA